MTTDIVHIYSDFNRIRKNLSTIKISKHNLNIGLLYTHLQDFLNSLSLHGFNLRAFITRDNKITFCLYFRTFRFVNKRNQLAIG